MYYLKSRYYYPEVCRFINADKDLGVTEIFESNLFIYCNNNPVMRVDFAGNDSQSIDLGGGWYCRIDPENTNTNTQRHIHIWKDGTSYAQNEDGSPHDKGNNKQGPVPRKVQKAVEEKTGWDYNGNRVSFFSQTSETYLVGESYSHIKFADGTEATSAPRCSIWGNVFDKLIDEWEKIYWEASNPLSGLPPVFFVPMQPSGFFNFSFIFGGMPSLLPA